jgi:hypothetical protein
LDLIGASGLDKKRADLPLSFLKGHPEVYQKIRSGVYLWRFGSLLRAAAGPTEWVETAFSASDSEVLEAKSSMFEGSNSESLLVIKRLSSLFRNSRCAGFAEAGVIDGPRRDRRRSSDDIRICWVQIWRRVCVDVGSSAKYTMQYTLLILRVEETGEEARAGRSRPQSKREAGHNKTMRSTPDWSAPSAMRMPISSSPFHAESAQGDRHPTAKSYVSYFIYAFL